MRERLPCGGALWVARAIQLTFACARKAYLLDYIAYMSERRKTEVGKTNFVTLTVVDWVDLFTRKELAEMLISNLKYCQEYSKYAV